MQVSIFDYLHMVAINKNEQLNNENKVKHNIFYKKWNTQ